MEAMTLWVVHQRIVIQAVFHSNQVCSNFYLMVSFWTLRSTQTSCRLIPDAPLNHLAAGYPGNTFFPCTAAFLGARVATII